MLYNRWKKICSCGLVMGPGSEHCYKCAARLEAGDPPPPRSSEDNALKAVFRKVI